LHCKWKREGGEVNSILKIPGLLTVAKIMVLNNSLVAAIREEILEYTIHDSRSPGTRSFSACVQKIVGGALHAYAMRAHVQRRRG
jgi:hypothetical protein